MNRKILAPSLLTLTCLLLSACDNEGDGRMLEKARLEGREQAESELKVQIENKDALIRKAREEGRAVAEQELIVQNEMMTKRARDMEKDLTQRHRFYQTLAGVYEGDLSTEDGPYKVKVTLLPTISPYPVERTRMAEEIAQDLNLLSFSAQVVEWNPASSRSGVGCRIENIRPDLSRGIITIAKETCGSVYALTIRDSKLPQSDAKGRPISTLDQSRRTAASILSGKTTKVSEIQGVKRPTTNAQEYSFRLQKRD